MSELIQEVRNQVERIVNSFHFEKHNKVTPLRVKTQIEDMTGYNVVLDPPNELDPNCNCIAGRVFITDYEDHPVRFMVNVE